MHRFLSSVMAALCCATLVVPMRAEEKAIPLWPGAAPGEKATLSPEKDMTTEKDGKVSGQHVIRLGNVSTPTLTPFLAAKDKANGAAVLVAPGGGYHILAWDLEGTEVCKFFNSIGVSAFLLKYRVPVRPGQERYLAPLQDAQRALGIIRQRASDWGIDRHRVGVLGFSAGGHLAAATSGGYEKRTYPAVDAADSASARPDFTVLIYPAYLVNKDDNQILPEINVTTNTPPAFIAMTGDDGVRVENAIYYYLALKKAKVPAELHIYPTGGHGYGLRKDKNVSTWPARLEEWMREGGYLTAK